MQLPALQVQTGDTTNGLLKAQQIAASQQGIDNSQMRNRLLKFQMDDQRKARAQQGQINNLASAAISGGGEALQRLMAVAPDRAEQIVNLRGKMTEQQRAETERRANLIARGVKVLQGTPPGRRPQLYGELVAGLVQADVFKPGELPEQYSPEMDQNLMLHALESDALTEMLDQTRYETITNDAGQIVGQRNLKTGKVESDPRAPKQPLVTVNNGKGETEFEKATGKDLAAARTAIVEAGQSAVGTEQTFQQLGDLMQEGVKTGSLQPLVASLQGIAEDLGVDLQGEAQALGIELGDLGNQQNFDRLATQVVINGFEQFKGNLNQKEVSLALGAFGGLGTSPEANADAIAAGIAASQIARERAVLASRAKTQQQVRTIQESILSGDVTDFRQRKEQIKQGILARRASGGMPTIQGDADYEALPSGTRFRAPDGSVRVKP